MAKKKLSFRVAHSLAATGIVFGVACDRPPSVNAPPPEPGPAVNTPAPDPEPPADPEPAASPDAGSDASAEGPPPEEMPRVNTPYPSDK